MAGEQMVPDFFRVEEAARVLRIGRTAAYELARQFLATAGASGLPVVRVGRQLRVPRHHLEVLAGGPVRWPLASRSRLGTRAEHRTAASRSLASPAWRIRPADVAVLGLRALVPVVLHLVGQGVIYRQVARSRR